MVREAHLSRAVGCIAPLEAWALFPAPIFLAVFPVLPVSARAIRFHHTTHDLVSFDSEAIHLSELHWSSSHFSSKKSV